MNTQFPLWILRLLKWFCPAHLYEEIEGDLIQKFNRDLKMVGEKRANWRLVWNGIRFFRPGILLRSKFSVELNQRYMFQSYFKIAYRQLAKRKVFSIINVTGLAVGITAFFFIIQYVSFELSYDKFNVNESEIYRVGHKQILDGEVKNNSAKNYVGVRSLLQSHFPEVKSFTGFEIIPANTGFLFGYKNKMHMEFGSFISADSNFFKVFPSLLKQGNPSKGLLHSNNIFISEKIAKKVFGDENPIGQELVNYQDFMPGSNFIVAGILKDLPANSHFHASFVVPIEKSYDSIPEYWTSPILHTYINIQPQVNPVLIEQKLNAILYKLEKENPATKGASVFLQHISDIHLTSGVQDEIEPGGSKTLICILVTIGIIILVIAWINYLNIETSRFVTRAREIGVRRIIGSGKRDLAIQFLVEYSCVNMISIALALVLIYLTFPHFSYLTGVSITTMRWLSPEVWTGALGLFVIGSLLIGIYPALYLLKFNPVKSLKGNFIGVNRGRERRMMIVIQFVASLVFIAFLIVVHQQIDYMRQTNKKIELEKVISLRNPTAYADQQMEEKFRDFKALENKLLQNPNIKMITGSSAIPGTEIGFTLVDNLKRSASDPYDPTRKKLLFIDYYFIPLFGLKLTAGRNYSLESEGQDTSGKLILNERAIRVLGFSNAEAAIGQMVSLPIWDWLKPDYEIIGVVEDYHHEAIKKEIFPIIFFLNQGKFQQVFYSIKLNAGSNPQEAVQFIENAWLEVFPEKPFEYFFLDDYYDQQFKSELHFGRIFGLFAAVAVFLACLGVLGMTLFEVNARQKEISIRKVLGATVTNLVALLSKEYLRLASIATLISVPMIYFSAKEWLNGYPEKTEISGWLFLLPLLVLVVVIVLTSGFQTYRAANSNPVDHLKHE